MPVPRVPSAVLLGTASAGEGSREMAGVPPSCGIVGSLRRESTIDMGVVLKHALLVLPVAPACVVGARACACRCDVPAREHARRPAGNRKQKGLGFVSIRLLWRLAKRAKRLSKTQNGTTP